MIIYCYCFQIPLDTGRKLNMHKNFKRRLGRVLYVLCTFDLRRVSRGKQLLKDVAEKSCFENFGKLSRNDGVGKGLE